MTQANPFDDAQADEDAALTRLEEKLCVLQQAVHELLAEEALPPMRPPGRARRFRHPVRLYVIAGGLAALFGLAPVLPVQNPVRMAVQYTMDALVQQLPDFQPAVSLGGSYLGHPAASLTQPSSSPLTLIHASPSPTPQPSAAPVAATPTPATGPDSTSTSSSPATGPVALIVATAAPTPAASSPSPTTLPSTPAPSSTGGAGPVPHKKKSKPASGLTISSPSPNPTP